MVKRETGDPALPADGTRDEKQASSAAITNVVESNLGWRAAYGVVNYDSSPTRRVSHQPPNLSTTTTATGTAPSAGHPPGFHADFSAEFSAELHRLAGHGSAFRYKKIIDGTASAGGEGGEMYSI